MKPVLAAICLLASAAPLIGAERMLTTTYQPLDGLGSGEIQVTAVTCVDWYSLSGLPTALGLITAANVAPTNNLTMVEDINLASTSKLRLVFEEGDGKPTLTMDATSFTLPEHNAYPREDILRATLECVRRSLSKDLSGIAVTLKANPVDKAWMEPIVTAFNTHDRATPFFVPET